MIAGWVPAIPSEPQPIKTYVPPNLEEQHVLAVERVKQAARVHHGAVETALQWQTRQAQAPYHIVDAVLNAGTSLDGLLRQALKLGVPAKELAEVADLHPSYLALIEDAAAEADRWI